MRITAGDLQVNAGGVISSNTWTPASGGTVEVVADRVALAGDALISAESSLSANAGKAGDISITARDMLQIDHSAITTAADHAEGGAIALAADRVRLGQGALISARSSGAGDAGNIRITAQDAFQSRNSQVTTESVQSGGGQIALYAGSMAHLRDSQITATVQGGAGDAGNITLQGVKHESSRSDPTRWVILGDSRIAANAFEGKGGNIRIAAGVFLADPASIVSASSSKGINGEVDIRSPITNLSGSLAPLPRDFLSAAALLRQRCAERMRGGTASSLVIRQHDGLPSEPDGLLPSPLYRKGKRTIDPSWEGVDRERPTSSFGLWGMDGRAGWPLGVWNEEEASPVVLDPDCSQWLGDRKGSLQGPR